MINFNGYNVMLAGLKGDKGDSVFLYSDEMTGKSISQKNTLAGEKIKVSIKSDTVTAGTAVNVYAMGSEVHESQGYNGVVGGTVDVLQYDKITTISVTMDGVELSGKFILNYADEWEEFTDNVDKKLKYVPRTAANASATSAESITIPNTPASEIKAGDYNTIFTHKRLYGGRLYDEGFNQLLNKAEFPDTQTIDGITFTNNGDGTITVNGTATNAAGVRFALQTVSNYAGINNKCLLKGCPTGGAAQTYCLALTNGNGGGAPIAFETGEGYMATIALTSHISSMTLEILITNGTTVGNLTFKPQLSYITTFEEATTKTINSVSDWNALYPDFYDYVPVPSPYTPVEIVPTGGKSNVISRGKNLFNCQAESYYNNSATASDATPSSVRISSLGNVFGYVSWKLNLKTETVTLSGSWVETGDTAVGQIMLYWRENDIFTKAVATISISGRTVTTMLTPPSPEAELYIILYVSISTAGAVGDYVTYTNVQLEIGDTATPFVPYVEPITTEINYTAVDPEQQSLIDNALSITDYASERNGNVVTVKTGVIELDGTEDWRDYSNDERYTYAANAFAINKASNITHCFTNIDYKLKNDYNSKSEYIISLTGNSSGYSTSVQFSMNVDNAPFPELNTIEAWKSRLAALKAAGTPVKVYYILYAPIEVPINEIAAIPTFSNNDTTVTSEAIDTTNAPAIMDFTTYIAKNLPKGYALLKDKDNNLIVAYAQTNMLYDVNTDTYLSDLINLKDTATGTVYKLTVTNGEIALIAAESAEESGA